MTTENETISRLVRDADEVTRRNSGQTKFLVELRTGITEYEVKRGT